MICESPLKNLCFFSDVMLKPAVTFLACISANSELTFYIKVFYTAIYTDNKTQKGTIVVKNDISVGALNAKIEAVLGKGSYKVKYSGYDNISEQPNNLSNQNTAVVSDLKVGHLRKRKVSGGLENQTSTWCYLNSALQAFMSVPVIFNYLQSNYASQHTAKCVKQKCILCPIVATLNQILRCSPTRPSFRPALIQNKLNDICPTIRRNRQEDSHEFLM